ncbi:general stress protein [Pantoea agglomerans]|uniref:general stress protein n=1 Tax=Enterobacter agglomerans TaxID=549 RepID=UPI003C79A2A1
MSKHRGGKGNFAEDSVRASEAGRKGGKISGGNFRNNPDRTVDTGRQSGLVSRCGKAQEGKI